MTTERSRRYQCYRCRMDLRINADNSTLHVSDIRPWFDHVMTRCGLCGERTRFFLTERETNLLVHRHPRLATGVEKLPDVTPAEVLEAYELQDMRPPFASERRLIETWLMIAAMSDDECEAALGANLYDLIVESGRFP